MENVNGHDPLGRLGRAISRTIRTLTGGTYRFALVFWPPESPEQNSIWTDATNAEELRAAVQNPKGAAPLIRRSTEMPLLERYFV